MASAPASNASPTSRALSHEAALRHKHDMADARAMMAAAAAKKKTSNAPRPRSRKVSRAQVDVALQALDKAEELRTKGGRKTVSDKYKEQALVLYQEAIQTLLQYLRQEGSNNGSNTDVDLSCLQQHIQSALTEAEKIKAQLAQSGTSGAATSPKNTNTTQSTKGTATSPKKQPEKPSTSTFASWFGSSAAAETTATTNKQKPTAQQPQTIPAPSSSDSEASRSTTSRSAKSGSSRSLARSGSASTVKKKPASQKPITPQQRQARPRHTSPTQPGATATAGPTARTPKPSVAQTSNNNNKKNQEFQHQILDDFYIPTSALQKTTWDDVAGLGQVKQALQESVILPLQRPDLFRGLRRPQNLLLYGPPGTGKTLLVRATASTSNALLFQCSAASLTSKWMGDAEKVVRALFQVAAQAALQHQTPALLFLDEVDSVLSNRSQGEHEASRRLKTEFMIQMEGLAKRDDSADNSNGTAQHSVLVLACTNCPWDLDPAVLRRFPRRLYVPLPDEAARRALLQHLLETQLKNDHSLTARDVRELATALKGFSGSDVYAIASQAAFGPIREVSAEKLQNMTGKLRPVSRKDWDSAIASAPPSSVTPKLLQQYKDWQNNNN